MKFDARAAKLLQAGQHLLVDGCPGLRLQATETRRTWVYRYRSPVDERMRQVKVGQWPAMTAPAAMLEWEKLRARRDAGEDLAADKRAARVAEMAATRQAGYTVARLCADYLQGHVERHRKERGAREMRRILETHAAPIAAREAASISRRDAFELLEGLANIPVTAQTLRGELGAAWDYALDAGRLPEETPNWWRLVMRGRLRSKGRTRAGESIGAGKRVLKDAEVGELLRWLPNFSTLMADVLTIYLWTGTRGSEIVSMEAREISQEKDGWWWTIPKAKTKNARHVQATDLRVPLVGRALAVVRRRLKLSDGWLFPASTDATRHTHQAVIGAQVYNHMPYSKTHQERGNAALPVTHWSPHDLRRTTRTMLAALQCTGEIAEAILGHMQPGVQGVYNLHSYDKERRLWLTRLDGRLEEVARVVP